MARAVIIDQSPDLCEMIRLGLEEMDIRVVAVAHDGAEGLRQVRNLLPDIVVLDLILPRVDGIGLIETLREEGMEQVRIFVVSGMNSGDFMHSLNQLDISGFFLKPYDIGLLVRRVVSVVDPSRALPPVQDMRNAQVIRQTVKWLHRLAVPPHVQGYTFLVAAIPMVVEEPEILRSMMRRLYPAVGLRYHASASQVERNMRHAIELAWNRCRVDEIENTFGNTLDINKDKPTHREFIAMLADHIRMERMME